MTITSQIIENILKAYTKSIEPQRTYSKDEHQKQSLPDTFTLSDEGKKRVMERLKIEAMENLKAKA